MLDDFLIAPESIPSGFWERCLATCTGTASRSMARTPEQQHVLIARAYAIKLLFE